MRQPKIRCIWCRIPLMETRRGHYLSNGLCENVIENESGDILVLDKWIKEEKEELEKLGVSKQVKEVKR